jgi:hypothetical protein
MSHDLGFDIFNITGVLIPLLLLMLLLNSHQRVMKFLNMLRSGGFGLHDWV